MSTVPEVLCIGEVLWDGLPSGLHLGGAVFNVGYHLNMLGRRSVVATRVGEDRLGREITDRMAVAGMADDLVQVDPVLETGFVRVTLIDGTTPRYEILEPVAWDAIEHTPALRRAATQAKAVVFGTLAQRSPASRSTIREVAASAPYRVLDVNLRPPHVSESVVSDALSLADLAKMAEEELAEFAAWWSGPDGTEDRMAWLAERFDLDAVCVTRGERGALLLDEKGLARAEGIPVVVADTVGAGDAFLAALVDGILEGADAHRVLARANRLGALVASRRGATPRYLPGELE